LRIVVPPCDAEERIRQPRRTFLMCVSWRAPAGRLQRGWRSKPKPPISKRLIFGRCHVRAARQELCSAGHELLVLLLVEERLHLGNRRMCLAPPCRSAPIRMMPHSSAQRGGLIEWHHGITDW